MVVVPASNPVSTPLLAPIVPLIIELDVQLPPAAVLVRMIEAPSHTVVAPPITDGIGFTVSALFALHPLASV